MNRPIYESKEDLTHETKMKTFLEAKWNCTLQKLPLKYQLDWLAMRGKDPYAFVEFIERRDGREGFETRNAAGIFTSTHLMQ